MLVAGSGLVLAEEQLQPLLGLGHTISPLLLLSILSHRCVCLCVSSSIVCQPLLRILSNVSLLRVSVSVRDKGKNSDFF